MTDINPYPKVLQHARLPIDFNGNNKDGKAAELGPVYYFELHTLAQQQAQLLGRVEGKERERERKRKLGSHKLDCHDLCIQESNSIGGRTSFGSLSNDS